MATATNTITVEANNLIDEHLDELARFTGSPLFKHIVKAFIDGLGELRELLCINQHPAVGTSVTIDIEPSDRFIDFLAALQAVERLIKD
jgi:hypothetical protein